MITWNMGGANQQVFVQEPSSIFGDKVAKYDMIAFCAQECPRSQKTKRAQEIEAYLAPYGFVSISTEFLEMWEMFLVCFIKADLAGDLSNVNGTKIAKGAMRSMIGNKGCIAYYFCL